MKELLRHVVKTLLGGGRGSRGTRGETITEVLVAVAIGALALLMLAVAISAASNMALSNRENMTAYYGANFSKSTSGTISLNDGNVVLTDVDEIPVDYYAATINGNTVVYYTSTPPQGGSGS